MVLMNKIDLITENLNILFPNPICELYYSKDYELLLKVMLSAQTTDKRVNIVTDSLFKKYDTLDKLKTISLENLEKYIKSIGMYKTKAKNFLGIVNNISKIGYVPNDREYLSTLPGVGRKTINVVLSNLYNIPLIAVDTHVERVSKRLGLAKETDSVLEVENKLMEEFKNKDISKLHNQLILFGRYKCKSKNPICNDCPFITICKNNTKKGYNKNKSSVIDKTED